MAEYLIQDTTLTAIAEAIRSKTGESGQVAVADMAEKISGIAADKKVETTVTLDFSEGDIEVVPEDDTVFSSVSIPTPTTLVPENIAEGVDIAGIIGTLAAGGAKIAVGTISYTGSMIACTHGLGVIPDFIGVLPLTSVPGSTAGTRRLVQWGISSDFAEAHGLTSYGGHAYYSSAKKWCAYTSTLPLETATDTSSITSVTETSFTVGAYQINSLWIAIGGLT